MCGGSLRFAQTAVLASFQLTGKHFSPIFEGSCVHNSADFAGLLAAWYVYGMFNHTSSGGSMFRTHTGQTGTDAYQYEAAAIANELRALDARTARLAAAMTAELPATTSVRWSIASDAFPDAFMEHTNLHGVLAMWTTARDARDLGELARCIAQPDRIFKHEN